MNTNIKVLLVGLLSFLTTTAASESVKNYRYQYDDLVKQQVYIIQLIEAPLTTYQGNIAGLAATKLSKNSFANNKTGRRHLNLKSSASTNYLSFLSSQQAKSIVKISKTINRKFKPQFEYQMVLNGFAASLTANEAEQISRLPNVQSVLVAKEQRMHTDRGPLLIQAPSAWNGTATGVSAKGEGIVVAVIDTGIRSDHPSFAEVAPSDGYTHINPFGNGVFIGYCASTPSFCNNKLIGAYNFADGVTTPEDENEHGTHVASTAAGNTINFNLGNGNGFNLSGVAPRANIIAYRIADSEGTASGGASVAAIDQAVADGVDVINYSFGGNAFDPWRASDAIAFRNARAAGIVVITSAGNDGPNPQTIGSPGDSPWLTSVAASTHDRGEFPAKTLSSMTGGSTTPPGTINGRSLTGELTAPIVYAGNFSNGDADPEQCLNPFPANTFNGEIVVCDRGTIARVQKAKNVAAGGAGGFILANVQGGSSFLADDIYVIPGIHIIANDGDTLKLWLSSGSNHLATIDGTAGNVGVDPSAADIVAGFSSRGSNPTAAGVLKPSVSAPGVSILAAAIGEIDYTFKQGTSMASPHVAGAAALIKQLKPSWTAGQIHSALVSTAVTSLVKEDGTTAADPFDIGGGRIDINTALNAGLLLDETVANFTAANPSTGGDPRTLNLPSMADPSCQISCSWTRTVTAEQTASWTVSYVTETGLTIAATPANFNLQAGQSQTLSITANIAGSDGQWLFGRLVLTPDDSNISTTQIPLAALVNNSSLPTQIVLNSQRDAGQQTINNITTISTQSLQTAGYLVPVSISARSLEADSDNSSAFDDLTDGVNVELINVVAGSQLFFARTFNSTAADLDLFVGFDTNGDGQAQEFELLKSSRGPDENEQILITKPQTGTYWVVVQNWSGAATGQDTYSFAAGSTSGSPSGDLNIVSPSSSDGSTPFSIDMSFDNISNQQYFGALTLSSGSNIGDIGVAAFEINRLANDVSIVATPASLPAETNVSVTVTISPDSSGVRNYTTTIDIPTGLTVDASSLTNTATLSGSQISWNDTVNGADTSFTFNALATTSLAGQSVNLTIDHNVDTPNAKQESSSTSFSVTAATGGGSGGGSGGGNSSSGGGGGGSLLFLFPLSIFLLRRFNKKKISQ